ncbi:hypothetical protein [Pendulispora albinea]|uniref:Nickel/cobalt efflux system n=1 Tax=Pendulispora albinea TaxID=2741071 RepID=A0ABZ2LS23_9BACT
MTFASILLLGFVLGMRHATDADHVVAVTTIVSRERSLRNAAFIGALWGLGHSITLFLVGGALVLFRLTIPPHVGLGMEMVVAIMLIVLGAMNVTNAMRRIEEAAGGRKSSPDHAHGHEHAHEHRILKGASLMQLGRALVVGIVHGLAGSAALALLVLTTIRKAGSALAYLVIFGVGTIFGMMFLTMAMAVPMAIAANRFAQVGRVERAMARATGLLSILFGGYLAYRIGVVDGLFSMHPQWSPE